MRWRKRKRPVIGFTTEGSVRIVTRFLLLPLCLGNEYRWLEYAKTQQRYCVSYYTAGWYDERWVK